MNKCKCNGEHVWSNEFKYRGEKPVVVL